MLRYTSLGTDIVKKWGLNLNGLMLLFAIVVLPDLGLGQRIVLLALIIVLALTFSRIHGIVPNTTIYLDATSRSYIRRQWPTIFSGVAAGLIVGILSWVVAFLERADVGAFLQNVLSQ